MSNTQNQNPESFEEKIKKKLYMYDELVYDHYYDPKNVGSLDSNDDSVGTGLVGSPACGDVMKLQIQFHKDGFVQDVKFKTFGCTAVIASSSAITEYIKNKTIDQLISLIEAEKRGEKGLNKIIHEELNLPPIKYHCSMLGEEAVKAAIEDYQSKVMKK